MAFHALTKFEVKTPCLVRVISTFSIMFQESQVVAETTLTPLPPNPASGSPLYNENWRNPIPNSSFSLMIPHGVFEATTSFRIQSMSQTHDLNSLLNVFASWTTAQRWQEMKQLFENWVRSLDKNGKPNKPDVNLYNHYLRASLMLNGNIGDLLDLLAEMEDFSLVPNTASFNLVLKAMHQAMEVDAAEKLLQRMEGASEESQPDDETYDLVIGMLFATDKIDSALKYIDLALKLGYMLSMKLFTECVTSCVNKGWLDALTTIIEKCKTMDQNKALGLTWNMCCYIAEAAIENDNNKLAYYALEFMARWIARGEIARPAILLSLDEGLIVALLGTAARTCSSTLLDASWVMLHRSLRQKKLPNPESYIGKIHAYASLGNLQKAFGTLREFESSNTCSNNEEDLFSPFTSLYPLVVAASKKGFETLDLVYFQLENLNRTEHPYKSVAALNCIILGCANTWDLDRTYQTFEAVGSTFGLNPNIHSYNALMYAFGKLKKTLEASRVFDHLVSMGLKPNAMSYSLLVDAHLINRDARSALTLIDNMVTAGFSPSKEMLKKVRRRCIREMDYDCDDHVSSLARQFNIRMGSENRKDMLFNLQYSTDYV